MRSSAAPSERLSSRRWKDPSALQQLLEEEEEFISSHPAGGEPNKGRVRFGVFES